MTLQKENCQETAIVISYLKYFRGKEFLFEVPRRNIYIYISERRLFLRYRISERRK